MPWPQRAALIGVGLLVLAVAAALLFFADTPGATTTATTPASATVSTTAAPTTTQVVTTTTPTATTVTTTTKPGTAQTVTTPGATITTTNAGHATRASDALIVLLVGIGAVLVIGGVLPGQITKIGLPGGGEIDFAPSTQRQIAALASEHAPLDSVRLEMIYHGAVSRLTQNYWGSPPKPPKDALEKAVGEAAKELNAGKS